MPVPQSLAGRIGAILASGLLAVPLLASHARAANPDILYQIVDRRCVPDQREHDSPAPCAHVDIPGGYAVLRDNSPRKPNHFLLIPTARITGIEDPAILSPAAPNYFADAWEARRFLSESYRRDIPRDWVALAINSQEGRTQNQLHIHIDCVRSDVRAALQAKEATLDATWKPVALPRYGHAYRAVRIAGETLDAVRPFLSVADGIPGARADMGLQTIAVVGAVFSDGTPGFYLLTDGADLSAGDGGSAEELQDYGCSQSDGS